MIYAPSLASSSISAFTAPSIPNRLRTGRPWQSYQEGSRHLQRPEKARQHFQKAIGFAIKIDKKDAAILANSIGAEFGKQGHHQGAMPFIKKAIELDPELLEAHFNLGLLLQNLERYKEAEDEYREALRLRPDDPDTCNNLGVLLRRLKRYEEAEKEYREALRLRPNFPEVHYNLGLLLQHNLKRYEEAEKEYRGALGLRPDYPDAHNNLGVLLWKLKRYEEVETECREALRLMPDMPEAHNNLGVLLWKLKRYEEVEKECREALRLKPDYPEAYNNLGLVLSDLKRYGEAEEKFQEALTLMPDMPEAHLNLAVLLSITERFVEAEKGFGKALELFSGDAEKLKEALGYLEGSLEAHPESYPLWKAKGEVLKRLNRAQEAQKSLERAEFYEAIRYYDANREELLKQYEGKFVAILHNEVIDSDEDFEALEERIIEKFGSRDLLVRRVTREPEIISISTPFLVR